MYKHSKYENLNAEEEIDKLKNEIEELKISNNAKINMIINAQNLELKKNKIELNELKKLNQRLTIENKLFKERIESTELKRKARNYQCCVCKFESDDMDKIEKHIRRKHHEMAKEFFKNLEMLRLQDCCVCRKVFYNTIDFKKHEENACMCSICQLCMPMYSDNVELRYCYAMEHVGGEVIEKLFV